MNFGSIWLQPLVIGKTGWDHQIVTFRQTPGAFKPAKGSLHNPTFGLNDKLPPRAFCYFEFPFRFEAIKPLFKLTPVATISPDFPDVFKVFLKVSQYELPCKTITECGSMYPYHQNQAKSINSYMAFSAFYFLSAIIASIPPFTDVFTDWESILAAVGCGSLPA